jgi:cell fate (sporulation/competence/biofilm development) regulator YmcA (YheA/YmcA/DUF963 family)
MTKNKLNKANEIDMKIRRLEAYKKFAENFKDIDKTSKTDVLIEVGHSDNWKIMIDEIPVIAEMFKAIYEYSLHEKENLEAEFEKL